MRLKQNQVWTKDGEHYRIVHLERLAVNYKRIRDLATGAGSHHLVSKKEFCRLVKDAILSESGSTEERPQAPEGDKIKKLTKK